MPNLHQANDLATHSAPRPATENVSLLDANTPLMAQERLVSQHPPAVSFIARSGAGKTTLLTRLIAELKKRGYTVGAIKHGPPNFEIDRPGKDSHRLSEAGADSMLISADNKLALVKQVRQAPTFEEMLTTYFPDVDIILIEGFKRVGLPKIEIHRHQHRGVLLCRGENHDPNLIAVVTDGEIEVDVPQLDLNQPVLIVDFLLRHLSIT